MKKVYLHTKNGEVEGLQDGEKAMFLGLPYARAERFGPPEPFEWQGICDCTKYGSPVAQPNYMGSRPETNSFEMVGSENGLNLNIWTADLTPTKKLPVVVYIHGGAFQLGKNSAPERTGDRFMKEQSIVFVSINYRLGVLGFLELGGLKGERYYGSGNNGLRDILLGLQWVEENISDFGGDPENLTLMGVSAGAKALAALMLRKEIQAMHPKFVLESGAWQSFRSLKTSYIVAERFLSFLPSDVDLLTVNPEVLVKAQADFCANPGSTCYFGPVLDNRFFFEDWEKQWEEGMRWSGNAIIGSNLNELNLLACSDAMQECPSEILCELFGNNAKISEEQFRMLRKEGMPEKTSWNRILSDDMYRCHGVNMAEKLANDGNNIWLYSFEFPPAIHGNGFSFLIGQQKEKSWPSDIEAEEANQLASKMRQFLFSFIREGKPICEGVKWENYHTRQNMIFDKNIHMEAVSSGKMLTFPRIVFSLE